LLLQRSEFPVRSGDPTKKWTHDLYDTPEVHEGGKSYKGARGKRSDEIALGACVYLKNLNYEVDEDDLKVKKKKKKNHSKKESTTNTRKKQILFYCVHFAFQCLEKGVC
jgi:hypothetical protein